MKINRLLAFSLSLIMMLITFSIVAYADTPFSDKEKDVSVTIYDHYDYNYLGY